MQKEALKYPTDKLDISIGYLRRVHFVTFYGAKRYRDEAHMLSVAPSVGTVPFLMYVCMYVQYVLAFFRRSSYEVVVEVMNFFHILFYSASLQALHTHSGQHSFHSSPAICPSSI